jgi:Chitobiase/beta-hexosaminidase C-terminal domain/Putative Ig domain
MRNWIRTLSNVSLIALAFFAASAQAQQNLTIAAPKNVANPHLSPAPGTYKFGQTVAISDTTPGAVIHFTTNGSTPTTSSLKYTGAIDIDATTTIKAIAVASGVTNSAVVAGTYTITIPEPSALSYPANPPLLVGNPVSLIPTVKGTVSKYSVNPALPTGLSINAITGRIAGTPTRVTAMANHVVTASNPSGSASFNLALTVDPGPTVHLTATATDPHGLALTFQWKTTDGTLLNVSGAQADWRLPAGHGLHFAYLLVSNGQGGYIEQRVVVSTDTIGNPVIHKSPTTLAAPAGPSQQNDYYRSFIQAGMTSTPYFAGTGTGPSGHLVVVSGLTNQIYDNTPPFNAVSGTATTNLRGEYLISGLPIGDNYAVNCNAGILLGNSNCTSQSGGDPSDLGVFTMLPFAITDWYPGGQHSFQTWPWVVGSLTLSDHSPCGISEKFFGVESAAQAFYSDANGSPIFTTNPPGGQTQFSPVAVNEFMDFALPSASQTNSTTPFVRLNCENSAPIIVRLPAGVGTGITDVGLTTIPNVTRPTISQIVATYQNTTVGSFQAPATPTVVPSDINPRSAAFLANKGLDSRLGACQYYKAVGAVRACDATGVATGAVTFSDWMRTVEIGPYAKPGVTEYTATYVNKMDLNLTRVHHSISYGPSQTAAYVCNYLGPKVLNPLQSEIDQVVANATNDINLVACVAMDYSVTPGVNVDTNGVSQPFTRFLIFGPSGRLLQSVNLDGRGEKFVPGTCVACHGGDHYAGHFPEDGSGFANIGAHFVPYDVGNFEFSSNTGLTLANQQEAIYRLNQNLLNAGPTLAEQELIAGWYADGTHMLNLSYVPATWAAGTAAQVNYYQNIEAHYCRSCHVALTEGYNFDHLQNYRLPNNTYRSNGTSGFLATASAQCGPAFYGLPSLEFSMPNSLVTFNRFWELFGNDPTLAANRAACYAAVEVQ